LEEWKQGISLLESLNLSPRRLSREDVLTGLGGSFLVHALIIAAAVISPFASSKTVIANPFWTVNLVTMQDTGMGKGVLSKETSVKGAAGRKSQDDQKTSSSDRARSGPLVPVKRLQLDEPTTRTEPEIKKMDAPEAPKFASSPQSTAAVEKSLEKLISKPKTPERAQPVQGFKEGGDKGAAAASATDRKQGQGPSGADQSGDKGTTGSRDGVAKGAGEKGAQQAGPPGGADGAQVGLARRLYYTEIWNAIRRQWALPEFLKAQKLETVLVIVVRRDGKVLDLRVEKVPAMRPTMNLPGARCGKRSRSLRFRPSTALRRKRSDSVFVLRI
jgi:colicin import membrane protein